jgi:hemolysin D
MNTVPAAIQFQSEARRIDERRPPWIVRATLYSVTAVIATALTWAALAQIDRIVVAPGKLVTTAPTIVLAPLETAVIRTLNANIGDIVRAGQPLATLDATFSEADATQLQDKISSLNSQIERLQAELDDRPYAPITRSDDISLQSAIWVKSIEEYHAKADSFDQQVRQIEAQISSKKADEQALSKRLDVARQLESMRQELFGKELGSKINYLDAKSQRMQVERDIELDSNTRIELEQNAARIKADKAAYVAEFRRKVGDELVTARRDRDSDVKQLEKAERRNAVTILQATTDAVVLDIAQLSVGSVLKGADPLYTLVPLDSPLEAEVKVDGGDVGHVLGGDDVRLKIAAWPFQKHGTLAGEVRTVSSNSFNPEATKDDQRRDRTPYYKARVKLQSNKLREVPANFHLIPGMAVTAEIKVGTRSVLSYFLYPILQGLDESIREP